MSNLFNGTIYFVQVSFAVQGQPDKVFVVSTPDMMTAIKYATQAVVPISLYASQYGANSVRVHQQVIPYSAQITGQSIDDGQLRGIVNDVASRLPTDACVVVLLPPAIDNPNESRKNGTGGYHDFAKVPYINAYISNDREGSTSLTVEDVTFRYAGALSHEIAEMVVDPRVDGHPEVCDPCGPNFVSTYLNYFDGDGNYITTTQTPPYDPSLGFSYGFYINGIVQPAFAKPMAAPPSACSYAPVPVGLVTLKNLADPLCCDGFFSADDDYRHAIVGSTRGEIDEVFFHPNKGSGVARLTSISGLLDIGAFYTPDDHYRHAIAVSADGIIMEHFYHPRMGAGQAELATIQGAQRVCGFYSGDDGYRHAIVGTGDGKVLEVFYHPVHGQGTALLGVFNGIVDIGAFYSDDDRNRHVIVGTTNGDLTEIFYNPTTGKGQTVVATIKGLMRLSAYYLQRDLYNRRVQVATSGGQIHEIRYNPSAATIRVRLASLSGLRDVGGFYSADDGARHSVSLLASGDVDEIFFNI